MIRILFFVTSFIFFAGLQLSAQSCKVLYREANQLLEQGKLEKAKMKYQQVVSCGNNLYVLDSEKRIGWINRCLRKPNTVKPFSLSDNEVVIPHQGGQDVITVDGNEAWSAKVCDDNVSWCKIRKEKGKIYVVSEANEVNVDRTCEVEVRMAGKKKVVIVRNEKAPEILVPSVENLTFPHGGETNTVEIRSNTDWSIKEVPGWVVSVKEDGKIRLTALANDNNTERTAEIKVEGTTKTIIINLHQGAGLDHLAFSKNDIHFGADGGDEYINIMTDAPDWRFGDFPHWCQVTKVADNLLRIHCTPNEPINLSREASVNVTTGKQTLGINVIQDAKPLVAVIPDFGIGGRAISFGFSAGYLYPVISKSSGGEFTGSVINYALGDNRENASYSVSGGFNVGTFADIRLYKNFYLKAGLEYSHYSYKNEFNEDIERKILQTSLYYLKGPTQNKYEEEYSFNQLDIPILASYRLSTGKISHVQFNVGPVVHYGISAKMKFSGNTDTDKLRAYKYKNLVFSDELYNYSFYSCHYAGSGEVDLYGQHVITHEIYSQGNNADIQKTYNLDSAPFKRLNFGIRIGTAFEFAGVNLAIEYDWMLTNMVNNKFWNGDRVTAFDQTSEKVMSGYKQHNSSLSVKLAYVFRYK